MNGFPRFSKMHVQCEIVDLKKEFEQIIDTRRRSRFRQALSIQQQHQVMTA